MLTISGYVLSFSSLYIFLLKTIFNKEFREALCDFGIFLKTLGFLRGIFLIIFTVMFAIPNKILINNNVKGYITSFFVFFCIVLGDFFPVLLVPLLIYVIFCLESIVFGLFVDKSIVFKNIFVKVYFGGDTIYANKYIFFFFGNSYVAGFRQMGKVL